MELQLWHTAHQPIHLQNNGMVLLILGDPGSQKAPFPRLTKQARPTFPKITSVLLRSLPRRPVSPPPMLSPLTSPLPPELRYKAVCDLLSKLHPLDDRHRPYLISEATLPLSTRCPQTSLPWEIRYSCTDSEYIRINFQGIVSKVPWCNG